MCSGLSGIFYSNRRFFNLLTCLLILCCISGCGTKSEYDSTDMTNDETKSEVDEAPFAKFLFEDGGTTYDLGNGEYIVAVLSATCGHCRDSVPTINEYTYLPELPQVIALMEGDEDTLDEFILLTQPEFPAFLIDTMDFFSLIESSPPRIVYIRDGKPLHAWEGDVPSVEILIGQILTF
jgi:hypothetical protein